MQTQKTEAKTKAWAKAGACAVLVPQYGTVPHRTNYRVNPIANPSKLYNKLLPSQEGSFQAVRLGGRRLDLVDMAYKGLGFHALEMSGPQHSPAVSHIGYYNHFLSFFLSFYPDGVDNSRGWEFKRSDIQKTPFSTQYGTL